MLRWQAIAGMGFDSAVGYAGRIPDSYVRDPGFAAIATAQAPPGARQSVRRFVLAHRVDAVVVGARVPGPWPQLFGGLGPAPRAVNGVVVYRVARGMDTSGP